MELLDQLDEQDRFRRGSGQIEDKFKQSDRVG